MSSDSNETAKPKRWGKILRYAAIAASAAIGIWFVLIIAGRLLAPAAINQIAELTGTRITVKSVRLNFDGSVHLKNPAITPKEQTKYDNTFFKAEVVYVRFGLGSLLILQPKVKEIRVWNFELDVLYDMDSGRWNVAAIGFAGRNSAAGIPEIELNKGLLRYGRVVRGDIHPVMEVPLDLTLEKSTSRPEGFKFHAVTAAREHVGKSVLEGIWKKGKITFKGLIASEKSAALEKTWMTDAATGELDYDESDNFSLHATVKNLKFEQRPPEKKITPNNPKLSPDKSGTLLYIGEFFDEYQPAGKVNIEVWANGNFMKLLETKFHGTLLCGDVSVCDSAFPYRLDHIKGKIDFTENSYKLNDLQAEHNKATFIISGWSEDFGDKRQDDFRGTCDEMSLDEDVYNALTSTEQKAWSDFNPSGKAAIEYRTSMNTPADKKTRLEVILLGAEAKCGYFPYPLKKLTGKLVFENDTVTVSDVVSQVEQGKVTINGKVENCASENPRYDIKVDANNISLGPELSKALPQKQKYLWQKLNSGKVIDGQIRIQGGGENIAAGCTAQVNIKKAELKTESIVVKDISALATGTKDIINIEELNGRYEDGKISLHGQVWPAESANQSRYHLSLFAEQIELNNVLTGLLPRQFREIAEGLKPRGKINISANFDKDAGAENADYKVTVNCTNNSVILKQFGCDLKNIDGNVRITSDKITLDGITANTVGKDRMTNTPAVTVNGEAAIKNADRENTKVLDFNGDVEFNDCDFGSSGKITEVSGSLKIDGIYNTEVGLRKGQANFAAQKLKVDDKLLTKLSTSINYEPEQKNWMSKNLIADCYDGRLTGQLTLKPSNTGGPEYMLQAGFNNIDLAKFLEDCRIARAQRAGAAAEKDTSNGNCTTGKMSGSLNVNGHAGESFPSIGRCKFVITEMQVGRVSPLAKILSVLKLSGPQDYAFDQMLVDSYIENKKLYLEKIDLSGRSLAFTGSGWMDLETQNVNVTLKVRGRRLATDKPSMLQSLTDALSTAVVRIDVTGDFADPKLETTTLPVIKDSLEILGTKLAK